MPRLSPEQKAAIIEQKLSDNAKAQTKLKRELRAVRSRQKKSVQKDRAHAAIVLGLGMAEHSTRNPSSEVRRVAVRILERYLETEKPDGDPPVADLLDRLRGASSPAPDDEAESSISDAAE